MPQPQTSTHYRYTIYVDIRLRPPAKFVLINMLNPQGGLQRNAPPNRGQQGYQGGGGGGYTPGGLY